MAFLLVLWLCPINMQAQSTELKDGAVALSSKVGTDNLLPKRTVTSDDLSGLKDNISSLIANTRELINSVGTVTTHVKESKVNLYGKLYANAPYTAGGTGHSDYSLAEKGYNLLDGNTETHFHSDYSGNLPQIPYIRVDLGEGGATSKIRFNYTTRSNGNNCPTTIQVFGTNNTLGEITTAEKLNNATAEISIAVKNISDTNTRYFAGTSNIEEYSDAVIFVWEPASEGYHYLRKYGTGEYIKNDEPDAKLAFGTKSEAQEFHAVEPVAEGTGYNDYNNNNDFRTLEKLVRFVSKDNAIWINCQSAAGNPVYKNAAYGAWTAHNVYLVEGETLLGTFTSSDQSNPLPTDFSSWTSSDIQLTNAYRFFKFAVTASESPKNGKPFFVMSEFGFTKVGTYEATVNSEYASYLTANQLIDALSAADALEGLIAEDTNLTQELLQAELENLQSIYNTIEIAKVNKHRANLASIISETNALINEVSTFKTYTLQQSNISSNAGHNTADGNTEVESDGAGIVGLLDADPATYFHSRWEGTEVSEPHYLQIDLGDGNKMSEFIFSYAPRPGNSPAPTAIEVRVGNDPNTIGESEPIAIYTKDKDNLPAYSTSILWTSNVISAAESFRYIRLTVTKSAGPGGTQFGGQYFFAMGTLVLQHLAVNDEYSEEVKSVVSAAINGVFNVEDATTMAELQNAESELRAAYSALYAAVSAAVEKSLPVKLTTDTSNPILYNILINRGDAKALQYDGENMVDVANRSNSNQTFGWYFMLGNDNKVNIYPYLGRGKALATNDYSEGPGKVKAVAPDTDGYGYSWSVTKIDNSDWYNITILNGATNYYLSNWGNSGNKMGFYNTNTSSDGGSMFMFEKVDYKALLSNEGTEVEVLNSTGKVTGTSTNWYNTWTSNATLGGSAALILTVGNNNITTNDDYLRLYVGSGCTYTLTPAAGYYISSYGFKFVKDGEYDGTTVSLVVDGVTYNPTDVEQTITSENTAVYPSGTVSFSMSGANEGVIVSDFTVTLKPMVTTYITYNYYCNSEYVGSKTLLAGIGCKFPVADAPKGYKNAVTPEGKVEDSSIKDVNCEIWSINIGGQLVDEWNTGSWTPLATIPDDVKINGETPEEVSYKAGLIDIESPGYLSVDFARFIDGNNRLQMVGVDLLKDDGAVVASDYHFGYRGHAEDKYIYSLNVPEAGRYNLRYLVSFQGESNTSNGEIDINLYALQNLTAKSHITDNWTTTSWVALNTIPTAITENVKYEDDTPVTKDVHVMEGYVDVPAGLVSVYYVYKDGKKRLDILGVDLVDAYGKVVASDYHFGYSGSSFINNGYVMSVEKAGIYKLRYIVSFEKSSNTSIGYNRVVAINPLEEGKLYRIKSVSTNDYCKDKYVHTYCKMTEYYGQYYDQRHMRFHSDNEISVKPLSIFTFEPTTSLSEYKIKNLHTGMYVKTFLKNNELLGDETTSKNVKIAGFAVGQVTLQINGERPMHAQNDYSVIVDWNADADNASLWAIEEVDYSAADFDVSIGAVRWSTLCLNYAVEVPEGVTAYAALGVDGNSVVLQSVGDVIPAGTAVLLNAAQGDYSFKYTSQSVEPLSDNKLVGTYYDSYIEADKENVKYYMLAKIDDTKAGMKQIYREYSYDENGNLVSHKNTDDGTHFKNNANKVYLPVSIENGANEVKAYSLRIIDGTTGVDEVFGNIGVAPEGIYDLSGRRIIEITEPGIYIVNGKKFMKK